MTEPRRWLSESSDVPDSTRDLLRAAAPLVPLSPAQRARGLSRIPKAKARSRGFRAFSWSLAATAVALVAIGWRLRVPWRPLIRPETVTASTAYTQPASQPPVAIGRLRRLVPMVFGWLDRRSNWWGAQGAFFVAHGSGSTIELPSRPDDQSGSSWLWESEGGGRLCLRGTVPAALGRDPTTHWGMVGGFQLCNTGDSGEPPNRHYSVVDCPWGRMKDIAGIDFVLEGPRIPAELRVGFDEADSPKSAYVVLVNAHEGRHIARIADAKIQHGTQEASAQQARVRGIRWHVSPHPEQEIVFDFCLSDLRLF